MDQLLPGSLQNGEAAYPNDDPSLVDPTLLEEVESLRKENLEYAERLHKINSENAALLEQLARMKRLLLEHNIPFITRTSNKYPPSSLPQIVSKEYVLKENGNSSYPNGFRISDASASWRESSLSQRESTSSSRESRLSVSNFAGAERFTEYGARPRSISELSSREPPDVASRKFSSFSTQELSPIGEAHGRPFPGGNSPSKKNSPAVRLSSERAEAGNSSSESPGQRSKAQPPTSKFIPHALLKNAVERESPFGSRSGFPIRGSAKIHPLGGDLETDESFTRRRASLPESIPSPASRKLRIRMLWQRASERAKTLGPHATHTKIVSQWASVIQKAKAKQGHWTMFFTHPLEERGPLRQYWDTLLMACLIYIVIAVPFTVAFNIQASRTHNPGLYAVDWLLEIVFCIDILVNFRSTYRVRGKVVRDQKTIAFRYLRTWFLLDLVSVLPITVFFPAHHSSSLSRLPLMLKILRLNKLFKLARVMRVNSTFQALQDHVPHGLLTIAKFFVLMIAIGHVTACLFYFTAVLDNLDQSSWPAKEGFLLDSNWTKYVVSLYWAFSTLCTVGYGDVVPSTTPERLFAIAAMLVGATIFAYFMGNMSVLVANIDQEASRQEHQMEMVNTFLRSRQIPKDLQSRVRDYYRYLWKHQVHSEENTIINGLNASLRTDVVLYMYREMVEKVPFFHGKPPQFISALVLCLRPEVYGPGDFIMREKDVGRDMYFIVEGLVHILSSRIGTIVKRPGEYFGEMALITGMRRSASCTAQTYCELYSLSKENMERVLQDWPEIAEDFYSQGLSRMQDHPISPNSNAALQSAAAEEALRKLSQSKPQAPLRPMEEPN